MDSTEDEVDQRALSDAMMAYVDPVVRQAAEEFPAAYAELADRLGFHSGPIGVVGGSLGGAVALRLLTDRQVGIAAAALINPAIRARSVVTLVESSSGHPYQWTPVAIAAADALDFVARADEIAVQNGQPPVLVVSGALDYPVLRRDATDLVDALRRRYADPDRVHLTEIADLAHRLALRPGVEPAPQLPAARAVDALVSDWFRRHLPAALPS